MSAPSSARPVWARRSARASRTTAAFQTRSRFGRQPVGLLASRGYSRLTTAATAAAKGSFFARKRSSAATPVAPLGSVHDQKVRRPGARLPGGFGHFDLERERVVGERTLPRADDSTGQVAEGQRFAEVGFEVHEGALEGAGAAPGVEAGGRARGDEEREHDPRRSTSHARGCLRLRLHLVASIPTSSHPLGFCRHLSRTEGPPSSRRFRPTLQS